MSVTKFVLNSEWLKNRESFLHVTSDNVTNILNHTCLTHPFLYTRNGAPQKRCWNDKEPYYSINMHEGVLFDSGANTLKENRKQGYEFRFFPHTDEEFCEIYSQIMTLIDSNKKLYDAIASISGFHVNEPETTPSLFVHVEASFNQETQSTSEAQLVLEAFRNIKLENSTRTSNVNADYCIGVTPILAYGGGFYTDLRSILDLEHSKNYNDSEDRRNRLLGLWYTPNRTLFIDQNLLV